MTQKSRDALACRKVSRINQASTAEKGGRGRSVIVGPSRTGRRGRPPTDGALGLWRRKLGLRAIAAGILKSRVSFRGCVVMDQSASDDHDDPVAGVFDVGNDVGNQQGRPALVTMLGEDFSDQTTAVEVESFVGFVEDEQVGVVHQGLRQAQARWVIPLLNRAMGSLARSARPTRSSKRGMCRFLAPSGGNPGERRVVVEDFPSGQIGRKGGAFGNETDLGQRVSHGAGLSEPEQLALGWAAKREQQLDQGRFSRPIWPDKAEYLAGSHLEANAVDGPPWLFPEAVRRVVLDHLMKLGGSGFLYRHREVVPAGIRGLRLGIRAFAPIRVGRILRPVQSANAREIARCPRTQGHFVPGSWMAWVG